MKVFCDLDGTLIDPAPRHHRVYGEVTRALGGTPLDQPTYWRLKRRKAKWSELLPKSGLRAHDEPEFLRLFIERIEDPAYLEGDRLFPGAREALALLAGSSDERYLVSLRRRVDRLTAQVQALDLARYFTEVVGGHSETDGADVKVALVAPRLGGGRGLVIGDTEADILTGRKLGLVTVAVTSGIRDASFLRALAPDYLLDEIGALSGVLPAILGRDRRII